MKKKNFTYFCQIIFKRYPKLVFLNVLVLVLVGFIELASVFSLAPLLDYFLNTDESKFSKPTTFIVDFLRNIGIEPSLVKLFLLLFSITLLKFLILVAVKQVRLRSKYFILEDYVRYTIESIFGSKLSFFSKNRQGELLNAFIRDLNSIGDAAGMLFELAASFFRAAAFFIAAIILIPNLAFLAFVFSVIAYLPYKFVEGVTFKKGTDNAQTAANFSVSLQESLSAPKTILSYGRHKETIGRVLGKYKLHKNIAIKYHTLIDVVGISHEPVIMLILFGLLYYSSQALGKTSSEIIIVIYSFKMAYSMGSICINSKNSLMGNIPGFIRVDNFIEQAKSEKEIIGPVAIDKFNKDIEFKNVNFSYEDDVVLNDVSLKINKSQKVALVGESGSGKTTLLDLILGFAPIQRGRLRIDDNNITDINLYSWRSHISYVPQSSVLFHASIRENILWANPGATEEDLIASAKLACAHDFISDFPKGYDTIVGDRGEKLSGGQVQRIALARAFVRNTDILILDEATSALDSETESKIQSNISTHMKDKTVIYVAHRLSTIQNVDVIYYFKSGKILESGSFDFLIKEKGAFYKLAQLQNL